MIGTERRHEQGQLTESECREVLARSVVGRLAVVRHGIPHIELVGIIHLDGEPVALLPEGSTITHTLSAVISPRRLVVLHADDADDVADSRPWAQAVTAVARPRWVVGLDDLCDCRRAAEIRGLDHGAVAWFLALPHPTLTGHRVPLRRHARADVRDGALRPATAPE
ncbi:hypothetical protein ABZ721_19735 [Streptomyces sp. NPDC006733]|uniref:hypothetical protein n=1 Tax=Streptomyces sp. NPDC006733 TaxID=3155460 RepID=UPI0033C5B0CC